MKRIKEQVKRKNLETPEKPKKRMKPAKIRMAWKIVALLVVVLADSMTPTDAQNLAEWFSQKKTQKEILFRQIAALKTYAGYVEKGYGIVQDGLTVIGDMKKGVFSLHEDYFGSLGDVNPHLDAAGRAEALVALQQDILADRGSVRKVIHTSGFFSDEEAAYVNSVYARLLDDCNTVLSEWIAVATPGRLRMKDGERLRRMDRLEMDMEDDRIFSRHFREKVLELAAERSADARGLGTLGALTSEP